MKQNSWCGGAADTDVKREAKGQPIVYCVYREAAGPVFSSQVLGPIKWLLEQGRDVYLVVFVPVGSFLRPTARKAFKQLAGRTDFLLKGRVTWLPTLPSRYQWSFYDRVLLRLWLWIKYGAKPVVLHSRGSRIAYLLTETGTRPKGIRLVFDCRGIAHAEYEYEHSDKVVDSERLGAEISRRYEIERRCATAADEVLCVSKPMARYLEKEYGVAVERITVIPCSVDMQRFAEANDSRGEVREELGIQDRFVVTYCGGLHKWQLPRDTVNLYRMVQEIEPKAHYLAITTEPSRMKRLVEECGLVPGEFTVLRVPHELVPRYLAAGDIGLLLREDSLVNRVASPVKFGEYLAVGLPVIVTAGVGDVSNLVKEENLGVVYRHNSNEEEIFGLIKAFMDDYAGNEWKVSGRCRKVAAELFDKEVSYPKLAGVYRRLSESLIDLTAEN